MQFEPVWISSIEHLEVFDAIIARAAKWRRALGLYRFPDEFPRLDMGRRIFGKAVTVPLVMFSQGELEIEGDVLRFRARDWPTITKSRATATRRSITKNRATATRQFLRTDWQWELRADDLQSVESYTRPSPIMRGFELPFTRVRSYSRDAALKDFLICVGGTGYEMDKIRRESEQLAAELQRLKSA